MAICLHHSGGDGGASDEGGAGRRWWGDSDGEGALRFDGGAVADMVKGWSEKRAVMGLETMMGLAATRRGEAAVVLGGV
ncbi:unnamed protein product [Cuscuta campestris]|uniref:Uncharacterized protein n=1 Tax=Cuscuta campestris TaxID=132261 RepID=A0A484KXJ8_9ASTE|nr:unnamed protein product [Cuscuta campestris]